MNLSNDLAVTRACIITHALAWQGTPYRHQASLRGAGCDCLGLIRGIWREVYGCEPEAMPAYTPDWAERRSDEGEPLLEAAMRHLNALAPDEACAGDLILFRWRADAPAKHMGILLGQDRFIHAYEGAGVVISTLNIWRMHVAGAFHFPLIAGDQ